MADWQFTPQDAETARIAASGGFGAMVRVYIRHPGTLLRAAFMIAIGIGIASIFSGILSEITGFGKVQIAALLGLTGHLLAEKLLSAAERIDLAQFLPWKGKA